MKKTLYLILIWEIFAVSAQAQIAGKRIEGHVTIGDFELMPGDTLLLGRGSMNGGFFAYLEQPANYLLGSRREFLQSRYAGKFLVIRYFKLQKDKYSGEKIFAVVNPFGGYNYMVDLLPAVDTGEIVAINGTKVGKSSQPMPVNSVADELLKLKQLLDAGAITQAEFDSQKKKLLGN